MGGMHWRVMIDHDTCMKYAESAINGCIKKPKYIISVGSGDGEFERLVENEYKVNIICVDPKKFSKVDADNKYLHLPDYAYIDDLIKSVPDVVSNCTLFLLWPEPNTSTYDIEAVSKLLPTSILVAYEYYGGAGGEYFHHWLGTMGIDNGWSDNDTRYLDQLKNHPYKLQKSYQITTGGSFGGQHDSLIILTKVNTEVNDKLLSELPTGRHQYVSMTEKTDLECSIDYKEKEKWVKKGSPHKEGLPAIIHNRDAIFKE